MSVFQTKQNQTGDNRLKDALGDVSERFITANPESHAAWRKAHEVMPGGNTRTVLHYNPFPLTMAGGMIWTDTAIRISLANIQPGFTDTPTRLS